LLTHKIFLVIGENKRYFCRLLKHLDTVSRININVNNVIVNESIPMRVIQFIILVTFLGWFFSPTLVTGNNAGYVMMFQTANNDSIIAPNVFTPNDDGENDVFEVTTKAIIDGVGTPKEVSLKIYTRAGVLVFSISAKRCIWDGRSLSGEKMAEGIYFYIAEVKNSSPKVSKSGFVHLYR